MKKLLLIALLFVSPALAQTGSTNVDPLDTSAVNAFYAMGPVRSYPTIYIKPATYWKAILADFSPSDFSPADFFARTPGSWVLTGLGSNTTNYPPIAI